MENMLKTKFTMRFMLIRPPKKNNNCLEWSEVEQDRIDSRFDCGHLGHGNKIKTHKCKRDTHPKTYS